MRHFFGAFAGAEIAWTFILLHARQGDHFTAADAFDVALIAFPFALLTAIAIWGYWN